MRDFLPAQHTTTLGQLRLDSETYDVIAHRNQWVIGVREINDQPVIELHKAGSHQVLAHYPSGVISTSQCLEIANNFIDGQK